jgi:hypothetical protein
MRTLAYIGYALALVTFVGGIVLSTNADLPLQGFSGLIAGVMAAFMLILPSTALLGIASIRDSLKSESRK